MSGRTRAQEHMMQMNMDMVMSMSVMYALKSAEVLPAYVSCSCVCE